MFSFIFNNMNESIQKKLLRVRPPRVKITYDVETGGAIEKKELPFIIGILADLNGDENTTIAKPALKDRSFIDIDRDSFNTVMKTINPQINLGGIADVLPEAKDGDHLSGTVSFSCIDDMRPIALIKQIPALNNLYTEKGQKQTNPSSADRVLLIDAAINNQLNIIMHSPAFTKLEASWRGLYYLVSRAETGVLLKLRLLNVSKNELAEEFDQSVEFDQSGLFKKIYEAEYGTYGGVPYSLLIGDYYFGTSTNDINLLQKIAATAATANAPFISAADASLFGLNDYSNLSKVRDLSKIFEGADHIGYQQFSQTEDSRYVSLVLPQVMLRLPYGKDGVMAEGFCFEENIDHGNYCLWGNAAWLLTERICNAFALYSWPAAICGKEGGGLINDLPVYIFKNDIGEEERIGPTQVLITKPQEKQLSDLGFIFLYNEENTSQVVFFKDNKPAHEKPITNNANANAQISRMLPYMLAASRFAHYVKLIMRNKIGSFLTRANVETYLNTWIANYILLDDNATEEAKATFPLRAASIVVTDVPGSPGAYNATIFVKPHFQLEELTTSIRLLAALPAAIA